MKRLAKTYAFVALASLGLLSVPVVNGQGSQPPEYQLKAAFLFNFAKFVDWPTEAFANTNAPFVIGVLGCETNDFSQIEATIQGKTNNNHRLQVLQIQPESLTEATKCHILFIGKSEKDHLPVIFNVLGERSVLTVGDEIEGFTDNGMINFIVNKDSKIRFKINNDVARRAQVRISSKLLSLAEKEPTQSQK